MDLPPPLTPFERLELAAARIVFRLPRAIKRILAGRPVRIDGRELDLDMQLVLRTLTLHPRPSMTGVTPRETRENLSADTRIAGGQPEPVASAEAVTVAGADGPLRARLYTPNEASTPGPLLVYYHGGGWVAGDLDTHDGSCRVLANASGVRVLSVDYRRPPENPFPAPIDDALAAFRDAAARAGELNVDPQRIAVGGDSAGGQLAAVVAQMAAADGGPAPAFQLLIYPVTDCVEVSESRHRFAEGYVLAKKNMEWYETQLLTNGGDRGDPRVSPLRATDLSGLAPALIVTAGFDILRDEGEAYAASLKQAGVRTMLRRYPGYAHGFMALLGLWPGPREAIHEIAGVLRAELSR
jgi:acetyl esterase